MSENQTSVVFTGKAGDYFGIWIVNLLLSMLTLGIYSAWAKVRRKKYFYNNTLIDGVGFDYHANPIAILKGRIIAFALFVLYAVLSGINPLFGSLFAILLFLALPWIVVRGMTFNARNSSHRGLRFDFDGKTGDAVLIFIGYPLLVVFTLGLAFPFVAQRTNKFLFDHHKFGSSHFQMDALVKDFYMVYLKLLSILIVLGIVLSFGINSLVSSFKPTTVSLNQSSYMQTATASSQQGGFIKVAADAAQQNATEPNTAEEDYKLTPEQEADVKKAMEQMQQGNINSDATTSTPPTTKPDPVAEAIQKYALLLGPAFYLVISGVLIAYMFIIFLFMAYTKSRITNLVMNNTSLDHVRFVSNQRMRDLLWLYLSNLVLLILTFGLATPWVQIRMARYRAEHLAIVGVPDLDKFVGEKKESSRAMGEEIADMFDIDISFG